ncbi:hypothetical protein CA13_07910 [Planctomycetes bacterium CA13]|uniref:OstA-like protein n=1 Tax=Novipirellula herctigrandis TaxID=2527986 RepID=A0A5C5YXG2_9BACT|nr:hypothetical protein CA13_07910 [Planctomycetes bacterium CA13]
MVRKLTHYITALVFLSVIAVVYQVVVVSYLRPPHIQRMAYAPRAELKLSDTLGDLFPEGAWQRGKCKRLQTSDGMLLFENWEQSTPDQWKLWPITVVIGRGSDGESSTAPVVIESRNGAEIKFTGSLDVMSGGAPPIQRGRMIGVVQISRTDPDSPTDSLSIRTANVGIDNQKVWTTEAIQMNMGKTRLIGRDLTIHLATAASTPMNARGNGAVLDRMELIYLDELIMPLDEGGLWPATTVAVDSTDKFHTDPMKQAVAKSPAVLSVQCGGRLEYDFAINQLMLRDRVALIHKIAGAETDRFDCDTLELTLRDPSNKTLNREGPLDWINRIKATGAPLVATLPNLDLKIAAGQLDLQASRGLMMADGNQGIEVHRGGIHARLESIVYQFDPQSPTTLGAIDARGIGVVTLDDPSMPLRRAQWKEGFKLQSLSATTADALNSDFGFWIDGEVQTWLADGGQFNAGSIEGVLKPSPPENALAPNAALAANAGLAANGKPDSDRKPARRTLAPDWVAANGNVHLDTAAIAADASQLQLFFVEPEPNDSTMIDDSQPKPASSIRHLVVQPDANDPASEPVARPRPTVRGDVISAKLAIDDSGVSAQDLSVRGSVELTHTVELGGQPMLAKLTGEELRLIDSNGEDVLHLGSGVENPARFELGDGYFVGPVIQIRPSDNIVWINEAGEFQIPSQALPKGLSPSDPSTSNLTWTRPPLCRWQGEMVFDGKTAVLTDGVEIHAALVNGRDPWDVHVAGDRMEIFLNDGVQVSDLATMRSATVQRIELLQNETRPLIIEAVQKAGDGITEAKHVLHAEKLTLVPSDGGKLFGSGPGWYRCWTRGELASAMPGGNRKTAQPSNADTMMTGIHLIFHDAMVGDMANQKLEFSRGIRLGVRDVASWDEVFDAQTMDAISNGQSTLDCDQLRFSVAPESLNRPSIQGLATPWETEASGGVVFRTRGDRGLLECTATRAAYASGKDLFTLHGVPNRPALFRQQLPDGQPGPEGAVRTMTLRLKTMEVENLQLERLNIAAPPQVGNR